MINDSNIDFLIVGAGLYGSTIARLLTDEGYNCLILEQKHHIAGNIYSERTEYGYDKHVYGPHIFHTNNKRVEDFVKKYSEWIPYQLETLASDGKKLYHLPFNMNTFYEVFRTIYPWKAKEIIDKEIELFKTENPSNLEEQALNMVGKTIYDKLIKNYTEKQWGKSCTELSPDIIKRLPLRFTFDNNYFNDSFQAIPKDGYTQFVKNIIGNIPCICNCQIKSENYEYWKDNVKYEIIYCGAIDELLDYEYGELEWRSLRFENTKIEYNGFNGQGNAIINDVSKEPSTRSTEHMWFRKDLVKPGIISIITKEYPDTWRRYKERYYPIDNENNNKKYERYLDLLKEKMPKVRVGGRLGKYKYFDMDDTILEAMKDFAYLIYLHNPV